MIDYLAKYSFGTITRHSSGNMEDRFHKTSGNIRGRHAIGALFLQPAQKPRVILQLDFPSQTGQKLFVRHAATLIGQDRVFVFLSWGHVDDGKLIQWNNANIEIELRPWLVPCGSPGSSDCPNSAAPSKDDRSCLEDGFVSGGPIQTTPVGRTAADIAGKRFLLHVQTVLKYFQPTATD